MPDWKKPQDTNQTPVQQKQCSARQVDSVPTTALASLQGTREILSMHTEEAKEARNQGGRGYITGLSWKGLLKII